MTTPTIIPMMAYADGPAAMDWLAAAFGDASDAWLSSPYVVDGLLVHVGDVDAHFARAKAAGAGLLSEVLLSEVEDGSVGRLYRAEDLEGHQWMLLQAPDHRPSQ